MRGYALLELGDSEAIDLFLREEDAEAALEDAFRDEPGWAGTRASSRWSSTSGTCRRTSAGKGCVRGARTARSRQLAAATNRQDVGLPCG